MTSRNTVLIQNTTLNIIVSFGMSSCENHSYCSICHQLVFRWFTRLVTELSARNIRNTSHWSINGCVWTQRAPTGMISAELQQHWRCYEGYKHKKCIPPIDKWLRLNTEGTNWNDPCWTTATLKLPMKARNIKNTSHRSINDYVWTQRAPTGMISAELQQPWRFLWGLET